MSIKIKVATAILTDEEFQRFYREFSTLKLKQFCELKFKIVNPVGRKGLFREITIFSDTRHGEFFFRDSLENGELKDWGWDKKFKINNPQKFTKNNGPRSRSVRP